MADDSRLARVTAIALALPEATLERSGRHATYRVRGKTFAYYLDDHQGDGIVGAVLKATLDEAEALVAADPARFYRPAYLGWRGWLGVRLDVDGIDWDELEGFVAESYAAVAPKRLAAGVTRT